MMVAQTLLRYVTPLTNYYIASCKASTFNKTRFLEWFCILMESPLDERFFEKMVLNFDVSRRESQIGVFISVTLFSL